MIFRKRMSDDRFAKNILQFVHTIFKGRFNIIIDYSKKDSGHGNLIVNVTLY